MRWVADENLDGPIVMWLRETGHDVVWMAEHGPGSSDEGILDFAHREGRIVITQDRDFGDLVFHRGRQTKGVVLLRIRTDSTEELLQDVRAVWGEVERRAVDHFIVVSAKKIRVRPLP